MLKIKFIGTNFDGISLVFGFRLHNFIDSLKQAVKLPPASIGQLSVVRHRGLAAPARISMMKRC